MKMPTTFQLNVRGCAESPLERSIRQNRERRQRQERERHVQNELVIARVRTASSGGRSA